MSRRVKESSSKNFPLFVILFISLILIFFVFIKLPITGFATESQLSLEKTIEIDVWANSFIEIDSEGDQIKANLFLDNGTVLSNKILVLSLSNSLSLEETTNSQGLASFNLSTVGFGNYSLQVSSEEIEDSFVNFSVLNEEIEILGDEIVKTILIKKELEGQEEVFIEEEILFDSNETNVTGLNETNVTILNNFVCEEFTEQVLWSSGYSNKAKGSTNYKTWDLENTCLKINVSDCFIEGIEILSRFVYDSLDEEPEEGESYVQISDYDLSICNNPEIGEYKEYLAHNFMEEDKKFDKYCNRIEGACQEVFLEGVREYSPCFGIKVHASQYFLVDVIEVKYNLCREVKNV